MNCVVVVNYLGVIGKNLLNMNGLVDWLMLFINVLMVLVDIVVFKGLN